MNTPTRLAVSDVSVCRAIHGLTVSGILVGMLALMAVLDGSPRAAVLLLVLAQVIDGIDGPLARRFDIATVIPKYDGYILDLVIDYVTCVLVPAVFAWQFYVVPHGISGEISVAMMLITSAMWFSRTDMMTDDHWFRGFPGVWNMVIPTLWLLDAPGWVSVITIVGLSLLSMTDVEFAHPVQALQWRRQNVGFMAVWVLTMVILTIADRDLNLLSSLLLMAGPAWVAVSTLLRHLQRAGTPPDALA
ncbi:MAG: CDP-alcohol phosphatidyltransferase family protein [Ilumatobacteraceae bacterium]